MNLFLYALSVVIVNLFLYALSIVNLKEGIQMKHFKNLELTAGAILAGLAGSSVASANHSATAHATTVVSNESSKTDTKQNDGSKTLSITTAKAEADANGEGTSPLKATTDSDVPLSPSDAKSQIDNVNKSNEKKNLDQAVDEAKKTDGIQVIKDANVQYQASKTSENDVKKDYQSQADTIKKQVEDQKQKLADYNTKKQQYDQKRQAFIDNLKKEGLWKEGTTDPSTLAQHLVLNQEPDAKAQYTILNSAGNVTEPQDDNQNSHQEYALTFDKSISGDILKVTYTDLKNSTYNGKKIGKIEETFSGLKGVDGKGALDFYNNPYQGFWYAGTSGITANLKFFDEDGKQITFDNNAPAYLTVSSLNGRPYGGTEKVRLLSNGKAIQIPESAVTVHDNNTLYSDKDTYFAENYTNKDFSSDIAKKYQNWDTSTSPERIFGSGLYQVNGDSITLRCFSDNDDKPATPAMVGTGGIWFTFSATVPQTSFDANGPQGPQEPITTIHYHDDEIQIPASITVKYVDQDTGKEIPNTQFNQKGNEGDSITYSTADTIKKLQLQGYTLVSDDFTGKAGNKLSEDNNGKTYVVTLKKQNQDKPSTPETKDGTQTYHFVDKNTGKILTTDKVGGKVGEDVSVSLKVPDGYHLVEGQTVPTSANIKDKDNPINILVEKDPTPTKPSTPETKDGTQTIHIIDKKTGNVLTTVVKGGKIGENIPVSLKVPKGYHLVQGQKLPTSVNIKDKDNAINVYVEKDEAKPAVTTPSNNNNSKATPVPVENAKAPANIANASVKAPSAPVANNTPVPAQQATLPQTGNSRSTAGIVAGSTLLATMATLGIAYKKRKN